jgi:Lon protease-like protein
MITTEKIRDLLTIGKLEDFIQVKPEGTFVGVAADVTATEESDWAHKNVVALYLAAVLHVQEVCVDYTGITVVGECDEVTFDEATSWVACLLRTLDIMAAGYSEGMQITRETVLAISPLLARWQQLRVTPTPAQDALLEDQGLLVENEREALLQTTVDTLASVQINHYELDEDRRSDGVICAHSVAGYLCLGEAIKQGMLPTPTEEYRLETLLGLIQEAQEQAASQVMTSE